MTKEFMLYIRNAGDAKAALSADDHLAFVKDCESYIGKLQSQGKLIAAQPLVREGVIISRRRGGWEVEPIVSSGEVQVGYYHIRASGLDEAIAIARENPEFSYVPSASIEVRQVKIREEETKFVYPKQP